MIRIEHPKNIKIMNGLDKYSSIIKDVKLYNLFKNYLNDDKEETLTKRHFVLLINIQRCVTGNDFTRK